MNSIREIIKEREIEYLIHFTSTRNLEGIFRKGYILPRKELEDDGLEDEHNILYEHNDELRLEGKEYINLSITEPNKQLINRFYARKRQDPTISWCIVKLDPFLLCDNSLKCFFSVTNAANSSAKNNYGHGSGASALEKMFSKTLTISSSTYTKEHRRIGKKDNQTTDNQAEILIKGRISMNYIKTICFISEQEKVHTATAWKYFGLDSSKFITNKEIF